MEYRYLSPFQFVEIASQIKEDTKDRLLSEEEIAFYFEKLNEYNITYKIHDGDIYAFFLYSFVRTENRSVQIATSTNNSEFSHPSAILARIHLKKRTDEEIWQPFRIAMYSFIENDSTLNSMEKPYMKRLTDIIITKAKKYEDKASRIIFP